VEQAEAPGSRIAYPSGLPEGPKEGKPGVQEVSDTHCESLSVCIEMQQRLQKTTAVPVRETTVIVVVFPTQLSCS